VLIDNGNERTITYAAFCARIRLETQNCRSPFGAPQIITNSCDGMCCASDMSERLRSRSRDT
jgi:hypothetical protein